MKNKKENYIFFFEKQLTLLKDGIDFVTFVIRTHEIYSEGEKKYL